MTKKKNLQPNQQINIGSVGGDIVAGDKVDGNVYQAEGDINQQTPKVPPSHPAAQPQSPSLFSYILGGLLGFFTGILGNLVAAWIQSDWMNNQFTTWGIGLLIGLTLLGILITAIYERRS